MSSRHTSHPPEHYAELRERRKMAKVRERRFAVLESDIPKAEAAMAPFVNKAREAIDRVNRILKLEQEKRERR